MNTVTALLTRRSAVRTVDPAPTPAALDVMLRAAVQAPDHGRLRPWRFITVEGQARSALGEALADALAHRHPTAAADELRREADKPLRAPLVIVVACHPSGRDGVPELEQILSAGAAAQNILLAAHDLGYGAMWRTGAAARDRRVHGVLRLGPTDTIIGFLYIGTLRGPLPERAPIDPAPYVRAWTASGA